MLKMPNGEIFINEVKNENSICITDNPDKSEIKYLFKEWKNAEKLIYVKGNFKKEFERKDYID